MGAKHKIEIFYCEAGDESAPMIEAIGSHPFSGGPLYALGSLHLHQPSSLLRLTSFKESWIIIFGLFTRLETAFYLHGSLSMATLPRSQGSQLRLHRPDLARKASSPNNLPSEVESLLGKPPVYSFWSRRFRNA
jgi:hypothetical protein